MDSLRVAGGKRKTEASANRDASDIYCIRHCKMVKQGNNVIGQCLERYRLADLLGSSGAAY
ncbi:hypothetical protein SB780_37655, partial [Burkholderia sp. SIMBA_057]